MYDVLDKRDSLSVSIYSLDHLIVTGLKSYLLIIRFRDKGLWLHREWTSWYPHSLIHYPHCRSAPPCTPDWWSECSLPQVTWTRNTPLSSGTSPNTAISPPPSACPCSETAWRIYTMYLLSPREDTLQAESEEHWDLLLCLRHFSSSSLCCRFAPSLLWEGSRGAAPRRTADSKRSQK